MAKTRSEIVKKSHKKLYITYCLRLRKDTDADLISHIGNERENGKTLAQVLRELWKGFKND